MGQLQLAVPLLLCCTCLLITTNQAHSTRLLVNVPLKDDCHSIPVFATLLSHPAFLFTSVLLVLLNANAGKHFPMAASTCH